MSNGLSEGAVHSGASDPSVREHLFNATEVITKLHEEMDSIMACVDGPVPVAPSSTAVESGGLRDSARNLSSMTQGLHQRLMALRSALLAVLACAVLMPQAADAGDPTFHDVCARSGGCNGVTSPDSVGYDLRLYDWASTWIDYDNGDPLDCYVIFALRYNELALTFMGFGFNQSVYFGSNALISCVENSATPGEVLCTIADVANDGVPLPTAGVSEISAAFKVIDHTLDPEVKLRANDGVLIKRWNGTACIDGSPWDYTSGTSTSMAMQYVSVEGDNDSDGTGNATDNCTDLDNGPSASTGQCDSNEDGDGDGFGNPCDFDVNNDGSTGLDDLAQWLDNAQVVSTNPTFDPNCDGSTGLDDLGQAIDNSQAATEPGPAPACQPRGQQNCRFPWP